MVVLEKAGREERTQDRPLPRNWKLCNTHSSPTVKRSLEAIVGLGLKPVQDQRGSGWVWWVLRKQVDKRNGDAGQRVIVDSLLNILGTHLNMQYPGTLQNSALNAFAEG